MSDRDNIRRMFMDITGLSDGSNVSDQMADRFLAENNWQLETSVNKFLDNPDIVQQYRNGASSSNRNNQSRQYQSSSSTSYSSNNTSSPLSRTKRYGTKKSYVISGSSSDADLVASAVSDLRVRATTPAPSSSHNVFEYSSRPASRQRRYETVKSTTINSSRTGSNWFQNQMASSSDNAQPKRPAPKRPAPPPPPSSISSSRNESPTGQPPNHQTSVKGHAKGHVMTPSTMAVGSKPSRVNTIAYNDVRRRLDEKREELNRVKSELETLSECRICCTPSNQRAAFQPCGHVLCIECCEKMNRTIKMECPICRQKFTNYIKVFLD